MSLATLRRRAPSCSAFLRPVYTLGLFTFVACRLSAQITLQTRDFEDLPVGAGNLSPAFTTIAYGPSSVGSGSIISHDPIQGVLASSPLGDGKAGYLGGGGTGIILDPGAGVFGTEVFDGSPAENATKTVQLKGSLTPVVTVSTDLLVQRVNSGNAQSFWIEFYDAQNAFGSGFAAHSAVWINPDNTVSIRDNQNTGLVSTGLTLLSDTAYHLKLTVDYNAATWSASLAGVGTTYALATNRQINVGGFAVSGFTTPTNGIANLNLFAAFVDPTHSALADRLIFDNLTTTASSDRFTPVPEAPLFPLAGSILVGLGLVARARRRLAASTRLGET